MIDTKDTVTYPLSAITGDEEESRIDQLERELAEAVAKERERCAKVCEEIAKNYGEVGGNLYSPLNESGCYECAAAIRKGVNDEKC